MPLLNASIGIKRMGELDYQLITASVETKYPDASEAVIQVKVRDFISLVEKKIRDPNWYPFKMIDFDIEYKVIIDEQDDFIKDIKNELGNEAYDAVVMAITEMMDYNFSGRNPVPELWNFRNKRRATLVECVKFLPSIWKEMKTNKGE
ncbi:XH domain-containing protein [Heracleum sosnowskyi]|uniref:XH domain-containing protein n=1 Tax=Heracleum sosnowskyi TaxID=360622 RepID=A0AAD8J6F0_9APIA|nr:XH domain-containing protein [Heracleum sosnowskyi]